MAGRTESAFVTGHSSMVLERVLSPLTHKGTSVLECIVSSEALSTPVQEFAADTDHTLSTMVLVSHCAKCQ